MPARFIVSTHAHFIVPTHARFIMSTPARPQVTHRHPAFAIGNAVTRLRAGLSTAR